MERLVCKEASSYCPVEGKFIVSCTWAYGTYHTYRKVRKGGRPQPNPNSTMGLLSSMKRRTRSLLPLPQGDTSTRGILCSSWQAVLTTDCCVLAQPK